MSPDIPLQFIQETKLFRVQNRVSLHLLDLLQGQLGRAPEMSGAVQYGFPPAYAAHVFREFISDRGGQPGEIVPGKEP